MTTVFATAGASVTDVDGNVICRVKNDLHRMTIAMASDFHEFADGEPPWKPGERHDDRCFRQNPEGPGLQIRIDGEWRP